VWEPLLALADLAGAEWPERARRAAIILAGGTEDTDIVVELLRDLYVFLMTTNDVIVGTKTILENLTALEDRPWASWRHDKPITARGLARLLGPLGVHPVSNGQLRGYRRDAFSDSIGRYLPSE